MPKKEQIIDRLIQACLPVTRLYLLAMAAACGCILLLSTVIIPLSGGCDYGIVVGVMVCLLFVGQYVALSIPITLLFQFISVDPFVRRWLPMVALPAMVPLYWLSIWVCFPDRGYPEEAFDMKRRHLAVFAFASVSSAGVGVLILKAWRRRHGEPRGSPPCTRPSARARLIAILAALGIYGLLQLSARKQYERIVVIEDSAAYTESQEAYYQQAHDLLISWLRAKGFSQRRPRTSSYWGRYEGSKKLEVRFLHSAREGTRCYLYIHVWWDAGWMPWPSWWQGRKVRRLAQELKSRWEDYRLAHPR